MILFRYLKSGWLILDFLATFPFDAVLGDLLYTRLIRLLRLTKLRALIDINRMKRIIKRFYESSGRSDSVVA